MRLQVIIFIAILGLLNVFVAKGLIGLWPGARHHLILAWSLAGAFFALQLTGMIGERLFFHKIKARKIVTVVNWASYLAFGIMSILCVYLLIGDMVAMARMLIDPYFTPRRAWRADVFAVTGAALAITLLNGIWLAVKGPVVERVTVTLKNLPAALHGFRIVQISDLHAGPTIGHAYVEKVVRLAQDLQPHAVALTGDFADGHAHALAPVVAPLGALNAPHGIYYIPGNHEYYWGADAWFAQFRTLGAQVLINEHRVIDKDGAQLVMAGVSDLSAGDSDPARAAAGAPAAAPKILLAHQPATYKDAQEAGFDLQLSGHTHNGQYFPFTWLIPLFQRFYKGLNRYKTMHVYVNRGTGYWGPPLRSFNPCEITLITLQPA